MGALIAASFGGLGGVDTALSKANDIPDRPTTSVFDPNIVWTPDPQETAKEVEVNPELIENCRDSDFVVVVFSGTGMETSHYQANMIQKLVEDLDGCVMYHWYGNAYDAEQSAESVEEAIQEVTPEGERKPTIFIGESFGGIAIEDIASEPLIEKSKVIDLKRNIMIATPVDMNDVVQDVFGVPVPMIKDIPLEIPEFGGLVVLANAINGQRQRNQLLDPVEWDNTFINAAKTRPGLMHDQLERIRKGMLKVRRDIRVDYIGSPASDSTVNTDHAYARVDNVVEAETRYFIIYDGGHDQGWLVHVADKYNEKILNILQEMFGSRV